MAFSEAQTPDSIFLESVGQRYIFEEGEKRKMVTKKEEENSQDKVLIFHKSSFLFSLFFSFLDKFSSLEKSQEEFKRPRFRKPHGTLIPAISGSGRLGIVCPVINFEERRFESDPEAKVGKEVALAEKNREK